MHEIKTETLVQAIGEKMKKKEPLGDSDAVEESIIAGLAGTSVLCAFVRLFVCSSGLFFVRSFRFWRLSHFFLFPKTLLRLSSILELSLEVCTGLTVTQMKKIRTLIDQVGRLSGPPGEKSDDWTNKETSPECGKDSNGIHVDSECALF